MTRKDALEILGLEADASLDQAKRAYRKLSLHYHPDKNPAPNATAMFRYIQDAWEYIQNDDKARQHNDDRARRNAEAKRRAEAERERQQAEAAQRQAEAKRRAEAEKARQHAEAKNSSPDGHDADETKTTFGGILWGFVFLTFIFLAMGWIAHSCRTTDKPIESSRTYIDSGKAKADKGQHFEAISDYDMAISLNPDNARAYYYRGLAKEKVDRGRGRDDLQKALKFAEKAKEWDLHRTIKQKIKLLDFLESLPPIPDD